MAYELQIPPHILLMALICLALAACGGNGGDSSAQINEQAVITAPINDAENSLELDVRDDFSFTDYQVITLSLTAKDPNGNPLMNTGFKVYAVADEISVWTDELMGGAELLFAGKTDTYGEYHRLHELTAGVSQILVVLQAVGLENRQLIAVDSNQLSCHFQ